MPHHIYSIAFSRDNQKAFVSEFNGSIKMIKWEEGANSGRDFSFNHGSDYVGSSYTYSICLTKDEKYLLVVSYELLCVFDTTKRIVVKTFKLNGWISGINLIKDGKKAIIAEESGNLIILDLETLEIKKIAENIANGKTLKKVIVI